ncbi:hypothetical protein OA86_04615 [Kaistella jeonii]|uniref:Uncharacterized protein n=1 Tax=Kaistella jeonii TaxID=266749 RepID=A0A0C1D7M9_9FLAO|nr:hypothetical protein OA86_04615 [Kaistella jeonii]
MGVTFIPHPKLFFKAEDLSSGIQVGLYVAIFFGELSARFARAQFPKKGFPLPSLTQDSVFYRNLKKLIKKFVPKIVSN